MIKGMIVDTVGIKTTESEDKKISVFTAFRVAMMHRKAAYYHVTSFEWSG